ncbi:MAG: HAMP domain-containing histidine kinase [Caldilineaceae bacterium]|nr:HAMP domain-containing histidine kinase [Caldilineaceae bacterium]
MQLWAVLLIPLVVISTITGIILLLRHQRVRLHQLSTEKETLQHRLAAVLDHEKQLVSETSALQYQIARLGDQQKQFASIYEPYANFIHNISHDMRTPLQSIQTTLDNMAKCGLDEVGLWRQHHAIVADEVQWFADLIQKLSQLSRLETPETPLVRESVNLNSVIEYAIMTLGEAAETQDIELRYQGPDRLPRVFGDRQSLRQVLINLVQNGIKYAKAEGGEVVVSVEADEKCVYVHIADDGIGIAADVLPKIFDTAYRAPDVRNFRRKGSGLGLAITKRIIEQHGGTIQVQSQLHEGTTFSFDLPLYLPEQ